MVVGLTANATRDRILYIPGSGSGLLTGRSARALGPTLPSSLPVGSSAVEFRTSETTAVLRTGVGPGWWYNGKRALESPGLAGSGRDVRYIDTVLTLIPLNMSQIVEPS